MDIYKVSFEMYYDLGNNRVYKDVLFVDIDGSTIVFNVYGTFVGETFKELVTGEEIPIPKRKSIPGFGAYQLNKVYLAEDYKDLAYYLKLASKYLDEYKKSFVAYRDYLNEKKELYLSTYMDSYGKLSSYSEKREQAMDDEFNDSLRKVESLVDSFRASEISSVYYQDGLQLSLFKDRK